MAIPLVDVRAQYEPFRPALMDRIASVLEGGRFILGPNVRAFEEEAAAYLGVPATVGVANGTDAIALVLTALGVGPGDEVLCPAFTFYATVEPIVQRGATPVFCDIDPRTLNLDPEEVATRVTERTKAIVAVHLFGRPAKLDALPLSVPLVEDAAQAFGARVGERRAGAVGAAATFSFFPTKNLFALGDGGLVAARDVEVAERVRLLRFHGSRDKQTFELVGYNSRLDEIQAAALRLFLPSLDTWNAARREAAARYAELGLGELLEVPEDEPGHVYHMYVARTPERERVVAALREAEIGAAAYYTRPLHLQPALASLGWEEGSLPETERAARENVALPLWAGIEPEQQERVVAVVRAALRSQAGARRS
ncbi:MAG: DegT/DnrJ/EryC1/StrS family aminotransferase [Thermoleophilia bacterium]|nr:DegT/DnrJ/EryC1/StrS family aminotransferase [Thermoleophilia bacterium]